MGRDLNEERMDCYQYGTVMASGRGSSHTANANALPEQGVTSMDALERVRQLIEEVEATATAELYERDLPMLRALAQPKVDEQEVRAMCRRLREPISVRTSAPTNPDGPDAADLFERLTGVKE